MTEEIKRLQTEIANLQEKEEQHERYANYLAHQLDRAIRYIEYIQVQEFIPFTQYEKIAAAEETARKNHKNCS